MLKCLYFVLRIQVVLISDKERPFMHAQWMWYYGFCLVDIPIWNGEILCIVDIAEQNIFEAPCVYVSGHSTVRFGESR